MIIFKTPFLLLLILLLPFLNKIRKKDREKHFEFSTLDFAKKEGRGIRTKKFLYFTYIFSLFLLILALSKPFLRKTEEKKYGSGIGIIVALDISGSMASEDYRPKNRLEVAKDVIIKFIKKREEDKIGLILFAGKAVVRSPLTFSHQILTDIIKDVRIGMIEDGTAIGMAIATAVNHFKTERESKKTIILLTDGVNNRGEISPEDAAKIAKEMGIKVYIIGVGKKGEALFPISNEFGEKEYVKVSVKIDEPLMKKIAEMTDGKYFRAQNSSELESVFSKIDKEEKESSFVIKKTNFYSLLPILTFFSLLFLFIYKFVEFIFLKEVP